jgi:hypothetical protein
VVKRRTQIAGQFLAKPRQLVDSPVMLVLSQSAFRALNRIESEHLAHGGAENGKLPVTYADFVRACVHPDAVAPAIRELEALGLVEITRRGYGSSAEIREPSLYRLTYVGAWNAGRTDATGTHEYLKFGTREAALAAQKTARLAADPRNVARGKKHFATPGIRSVSTPECGVESQNPRPRNPGLQSHPRNPGSPSISRRGSPHLPIAGRCGDEKLTPSDVALLRTANNALPEHAQPDSSATRMLDASAPTVVSPALCERGAT